MFQVYEDPLTCKMNSDRLLLFRKLLGLLKARVNLRARSGKIMRSSENNRRVRLKHKQKKWLNLEVSRKMIQHKA